MTYDPSIPSAGNKISAQFGQVQTNFDQANTLFALDHYAFNDMIAPTQRGHHKVISAVQQSALPAQSATTGKITTVNNISSVETTRSDPYYTFDSGTLGTGLTAPLVPFKVFCTFDANIDTTPLPAINIYQSFNVSQIDHSGDALPFRTFDITFTNKLSDAPAATAYVCLVLVSAISTIPSGEQVVTYSNTLNSRVTLTAKRAILGGPTRISMGVITL